MNNNFQKSGWLIRYAQEGSALNQIVADVQNTLEGAAVEIKNQKPGKNVKKLLSMLQSENYAPIIEKMKEESQEVADLVSFVEKLAQESNPMTALKCGGRMKKKVKKATKGGECKPCKKLMKVGGQLTEVEVDCMGNVVKLACGGKVRKGVTGLDVNTLRPEYKQARTGEATDPNNRVHYFYNGKNWMIQGATENNGKFMWNEGPGDEVDFTNEDQLSAFNTWAKNSAPNLFVEGYEYTPGETSFIEGTGKFKSKNAAKAALGNLYDTGVKSVKGPLGTEFRFNVYDSDYSADFKPSNEDIFNKLGSNALSLASNYSKQRENEINTAYKKNRKVNTLEGRKAARMQRNIERQALRSELSNYYSDYIKKLEADRKQMTLQQAPKEPEPTVIEEKGGWLKRFK